MIEAKEQSVWTALLFLKHKPLAYGNHRKDKQRNAYACKQVKHRMLLNKSRRSAYLKAKD